MRLIIELHRIASHCIYPIVSFLFFSVPFFSSFTALLYYIHTK